MENRELLSMDLGNTTRLKSVSQKSVMPLPGRFRQTQNIVEKHFFMSLTFFVSLTFYLPTLLFMLCYKKS